MHNLLLQLLLRHDVHAHASQRLDLLVGRQQRKITPHAHDDRAEQRKEGGYEQQRLLRGSAITQS